jgi:hypothetical protein
MAVIPMSDRELAERLARANRKQVETGRRRAFIVMAGAGRPSTPCSADISQRRGWRPFGRHDDNAMAARLNLFVGRCSIKHSMALHPPA